MYVQSVWYSNSLVSPESSALCPLVPFDSLFENNPRYSTLYRIHANLWRLTERITYICTVHMYPYVHMYVRTYVLHMHVFANEMSIYTLTLLNTCVQHTYVHTYVCTFVYLCTLVCTYMKHCLVCRKQHKEMLDKEEQRKKALLEAKRAHEVTVALMQESLVKERARKESEETESRQLLEKRVNAVLSLKKNIDAQRVSAYDVL